jgi:hypothetical protein
VAENPTNLHHIRSNEPDLLPKCPVHFVTQGVPTPGLEPMARTGTQLSGIALMMEAVHTSGRSTSTGQHGDIPQKAVIFIIAAVRT